MTYFNFKPESMVLFSKYEDDVKEYIDSYYRCLHDVDKKWTLEEEKNCQKSLGMTCILD